MTWLDNGAQYLFNDTDLRASVTAGLTFAELLPTQLSMNTTFPWGAPFYDFMLGQPSISRSGKAIVPVSFENYASFDLDGNLTVRLYDCGNSLLGESQTPLNVTQYQSFAGKLQFQVPLSGALSSAVSGGHFEVYFDTSLFECGPVVFPYG